MTDATDPRLAPLGAKFKLLYGSGAMIDGIYNAALTYFLLFYFTSVCGLSGTLGGTALLIGLLIDAFADPIIGLLSDNTRTRFGRRLPFLIISTIPIAVVFGMLFSIPVALHGAALFAYATLCSVGLRIGLSLFALPYFAVGAEVTDDYGERSSVVAYRICFQMLGSLAAIVLGLSVFMAGPKGLLDRLAYSHFAWSCAAMIAVAGLVTAGATRGVLGRLYNPTPSGGSAVRQFIAELRDLFRNRSFVALFTAVLIFFVAQGLAGALTIYVNRYFWNLSTSAVQITIVGIALGPIIGAPLNAILAKRFEKRTLTVLNNCVFAVSQIWLPLLRIAGLFPGSGPFVTTVLFFNALIAGAALVGGAIGFQSMMADAADEHEHLFGVRREGLFFSGLTLAVKAASGLGGFLAGATLDLIRFPTAIASKSGMVDLSAAQVRYLGTIAGPLPAAILLIGSLTLLFYPLTRSKHAAIIEDLIERRGT